MVELYARKFRKRLYETKNVGSNVNFFNEVHAEINSEFTSHQAVIQSELRTHEDTVGYLNSEIEKVNLEIEALAEFCKSCKPKKKKKKKKKG